MTKANIQPANSETFARAVSILKDGGLVALPTETVYGLAADAGNQKAVKHIYAVKGRPAHNPLIAHVLSPEKAGDLAEISAVAQDLIDAFWPGPLTLVLPRKTSQPGELPTIAMRCPDRPWRRAFIEAGFKGHLVMPSANRSGHISPTTAQHVADDLGSAVDLIIDAGPCTDGIESTIVKIENNHGVLLRPGALPTSALAPYIPDLRLPNVDAPISAPGMLKSHYAPNAKVRLDATEKRCNEAYLAFGPTDIAFDLSLSETGDLSEAAQNLYSALRRLDTVKTIAVAPIPLQGLGEAINDRLRRAAAER